MKILFSFYFCFVFLVAAKKRRMKLFFCHSHHALSILLKVIRSFHVTTIHESRRTYLLFRLKSIQLWMWSQGNFDVRAYKWSNVKITKRENLFSFLLNTFLPYVVGAEVIAAISTRGVFILFTLDQNENDRKIKINIQLKRFSYSSCTDYEQPTHQHQHQHLYPHQQR